MNEENLLLVTYEPVIVQDFRKTTDHFRDFERIYPTLVKKNQRCKHVTACAWNARILPDYTQKSPWTLLTTLTTQVAQNIPLHATICSE